MTKTLSPSNKLDDHVSDDICDAVCRTFDRAFERNGANKKSVLSTFEAALEGLKKSKEPELRVRSIAKSAALSTGRCHGNIVETGRHLLEHLEDLSEKHGLKFETARDQLILGMAEGACQISPIVYCRFLEVAVSYREGAEEFVQRNRRLPVLAERSDPLPVIVPYYDELTIHPETATDEPQAFASETPVEREEWTRPKQRGIFRRLTEAVGHFFGG